MLKSIALVFSTSLSVHAWASVPTKPVHFDPPDLNLEYQLYRQYLGANGERPTQAPKGIIESYRLQAGENLWNLSQMLYGDGTYWPKVWAQNKSITNPHLIRPGHTLHFQMGSEDDTPSFRFSEAEEPGLELAAATHETSGPQIEIPPPETPSRPVIKVPSSFPEWQSVYRHHADFQVDFSKMNTARPMPPDRLPLSAYVQDTPLVSSGSFLELERESGLPVKNQYVYVKVKKGTGQVGQKYMIVKDMGLIRKLNKQIEGDINAHYIQVFGDLELTDTAPATFRKSKDRENFDVFRGIILNVTSLTLTHYDLIPGMVETVDLSRTGPEGSANAQILGSNKHDSSALYGSGDIVFLNKGERDGVQTGQILDIYIDRTIRDERTPVAFSSVSSGRVKVVKTSGSVSTGVILRAIDSIQQGDRVQPRVGANEAEPEPAGPEVPQLQFSIPGRSLGPDSGGSD